MNVPLSPGRSIAVDPRRDIDEILDRVTDAAGRIAEAEMRRVFNMGIGYTLIVRPAFADSIAEQLTKLGERVHTIGRIEKGSGTVREV